MRFVLVLALLFVAFHFLGTTRVYESRLFPAYLGGLAGSASGVLRALGYDVQAVASSLVSPRLTLQVREGCDAVEPILLLVFAILASPVRWRARLAGTAAGVPILLALNLVRIVSLFAAGVHSPRWFEVMHVEIWQPLFMFCAIVLWAAWAAWATRPRSRADAAVA